MYAKGLCDGANNPNNHEIPYRGIITTHASTPSLKKKNNNNNNKETKTKQEISIVL